DRYEVEQLDDVLVAHPDTPVRGWHTERFDVRRAVDVDVTPHRVNSAETIPAGFEAAEPENSRQDPVPAGVRPGQLRRPGLAGGSPADQHRAGRQARADARTDQVAPARRLLAAAQLACAAERRRDAPVSWPQAGAQ